MASALTIAPAPIKIEQGSTDTVAFAYSKDKDSDSAYKVSIVKGSDTESTTIIKELPESKDTLNLITFKPAEFGIDTSKLGKTGYRLVLEKILSSPQPDSATIRVQKTMDVSIVVE